MNTATKHNTLPACFWMQAGVVKTKHCRTDFLCAGCRFDQAMTQTCLSNETLKKQNLTVKGKGAGFVHWKDRLKKMPLAKQPCIHHMKGHIDFKNCTKAYHCVDCQFDQYFYDQFKVNTVLKPVEFEEINGIFLPIGYYLHPGHTWIKIEDHGMVRLGIDDFSARLLGNFDRVHAPLMGKKLEQGKPAFTLSRQGNKVDFSCPVNGVVTDVNARVRKAPHLISQEPYTDGWILMLYCPGLKQDLKQLLFMETGKGFMEKEVNRLYGFLEQETQIKAADGGTLVPDIFGNLPGVSWKRLIKKFICQGP